MPTPLGAACPEPPPVCRTQGIVVATTSCGRFDFVLKFSGRKRKPKPAPALPDNQNNHASGGFNLKNTTLVQTLIAAALGLTVTTVGAQVPNNDGHLFDTRGAVAKSGFGLCWKTTRWTPAMAIAECDPDLVKKPEPPKPAAPAAAPAKPKACNFSYALQTDATFAFGKSDLNAAGKDQLDKNVIAKLGNCASVKLMLVTGHTDRIGSHETNQKLSEKRAEAVKAYLVSKGAKADSLETMGAGKTQAVPGVKCDDKLPRKKLIECLAPNRRVVVEVQGPGK